jgi:hypothetical protein
MPAKRDARQLTDRELLVLLYEDMHEIKPLLKEYHDRIFRLELKASEPSPKIQSIGIPAGVASAALVVWEYIKARTGIA